MEIHRGTAWSAMVVTARMDEPIVYLGDLLHLDGPLAYAAYHDLDERTRKEIEPIQTTERPIDIGLPLSVWSVAPSTDDDPRLLKTRNGIRRGIVGGNGIPKGTEPRLWGWCASAADETCWLGRGALEVRKKPELGKMGRYTTAKSANLGAGPMKAYDLRLPTVAALEVVWWCHGDPDCVRYLLQSFVPSIGKKRSTGNGRVREWIVEPCHVDRSVLDGDKIMRRLPLGAVDGPTGHGAIRPPYYHHTRMMPSVEPWAT